MMGKRFRHAVAFDDPCRFLKATAKVAFNYKIRYAQPAAPNIGKYKNNIAGREGENEKKLTRYGLPCPED
jgi:hypothetical protein